MKKLSKEKIETIDNLIPIARYEADQYIKKHGEGKKTWSEVYHSAMDRMAKEAGVRQ